MGSSEIPKNDRKTPSALEELKEQGAVFVFGLFGARIGGAFVRLVFRGDDHQERLAEKVGEFFGGYVGSRLGRAIYTLRKGNKMIELGVCLGGLAVAVIVIILKKVLEKSP